MKTSLRFFSGQWWIAALALTVGSSLSAQTSPPPAPTAPGAATAYDDATTALTAEELDQLTGPIALYPDALVALILPAATNPSDVVLAARYLAAGGDPDKTADQPWDDAIKGLAHYPEVVKWMDENLEWTKDLGDAYAAQSGDVLGSIQRLRAKAKANGVLTDNKEQQVVTDAGNIRIVPTSPEVIYIPQYDPAVVYVDRPVYYGSPYLTFGVGFGVGGWLAYDFDWNRRVIWVANRNYYPHYRYDWRRRPVFPAGRPGPGVHPEWRRWTPPPRRPIVQPPRPGGPGGSYHRPIPQPRPFRNSRPDQSRPDHRPDKRVGMLQTSSRLTGTPPAPRSVSSPPRFVRRLPPAPGSAPAIASQGSFANRDRPGRAEPASGRPVPARRESNGRVSVPPPSSIASGSVPYTNRVPRAPSAERWQARPAAPVTSEVASREREIRSSRGPDRRQR